MSTNSWVALQRMILLRDELVRITLAMIAGWANDPNTVSFDGGW